MYTPTNWQDHIVEKPHRFEMTNGESPGMVYLNPAPGEVDQQGTPQNAQNFNHMEKGIAEVTAAMDRLMAEAQEEFDTLKKISDELKKKADKNGGITVANSLQVAALAGGASIAKGTDLDTLTVPGTYAAANAAVAATLLHCPITTSGFVMYTILTYPYNGDNSYRTQIIICGADTPSSFWIRNSNGSGKWCDWVRMKYTDPTDITGNAATADKLKTARVINGMYFDGNADRTNYAVCGTAGATAEKTVTCAGFTPSLGAEIVVYFQNANTAENPTLNVSGTGAKPIYYHGKAIPASYLKANGVYTFRYNGAVYYLVGDIDTTYSNMVGATASAAGKAGLVPAPAAGAQAKYLRGDGTWQTPPDNYTVFAGVIQATATSFTTTVPIPANKTKCLIWLSSDISASNGSLGAGDFCYITGLSQSMAAKTLTPSGLSHSLYSYKILATGTGQITITQNNSKAFNYMVMFIP